VPDPGDVDEDQEDEGSPQKERDVPAKDVVIDPGKEKGQGGSHHEEENLPFEIVRRVVPEPIGRPCRD